MNPTGMFQTMRTALLVLTLLATRTASDDVVAEYDESVVHGLHITTTALLADPIKILRTVEYMLYTKAIEFNSTNSTREDKDDLRSLMYSSIRASGSDSTLTTWVGVGFEDDGSSMWMYPGNASISIPSLETYNGARVMKETMEIGWGGKQREECASTVIATKYTVPTPAPTPFPTPQPTQMHQCLYVRNE